MQEHNERTVGNFQNWCGYQHGPHLMNVHNLIANAILQR